MFNKIRKKLRKKLKKNKRIYYQKMLHRNATKNSSSFFNTMRTLSGNTRKEQEELSEKQVEGFNIYFTTIGKILSNKLIDPGKNGRQKRTLNSMFLTSAKSKLSLVIKKLKNKYSTDCVNNFILKKIEYDIVPTLSFLVNKCFEKGIFPKCLKKAVVIPIHKCGNAYEVQNYRPISLLPTIGKILEKLLCDRMTAFLEKYDLLNKNQFGFRQKRGTTDALVNFLEGIREVWENGFKEMKAVFIDLKKAFDTVEQNLLLEMLENIGMRGPVLKLLKSYLSDRQQCVRSVEFRSEFLPIEYGVPQGSVLGPLLSLVYINDIQEFCGDSTAILFADDAVLKQNVYSSKEKFEKSLESVADYFLQNKLTLNLEKTTLVNLNAIRKSSQQEIILQNDAIYQKPSLKYLGVQIDEKFNFNRHILELCAKLSKFFGLFYKLRSILTTAQLLVTYKVYVQPILNYGVLVYGTSSKTTLQPLEAKVKQIARIFFKKRKTESTLQNREKYKMHSIKDLHFF